MTLQTQQTFTIPEETVRVAHAAYPHGSTAMKMRDALGSIYEDQSFAHLFPQNGRPVEAPWRLALITVLQFMEELPDRQAADAVRGRIDWKYLLGLELTDPGFDASVLSECADPAGSRGRRTPLVRCHAGLVQRARLGQISWATAHRFDPYQPLKSERLID